MGTAQRCVQKFIPENGNLYYHDASRSKYLSVNRATFIFGIDNKNIFGERYMSVEGKVRAMVTGIKLPRNGTIISLTAQSQNNTVSSFHIRKNNLDTNITTLQVSGTNGDVIDNLNVDVEKKDWLQAFLSVDDDDTINYPILTVEIAWRR